MKRKIYKKVSGYFYNHNGDHISGEFHIYVGGKKWSCKNKFGHRYYYPRIFFWADRYSADEWIEVPKNSEMRIREKKKLEDLISRHVDFLKGNPLSGSYSNNLKNLLEIQKKHFSNSLDFIQEDL